jgi:amino acid permease
MFSASTESEFHRREGNSITNSRVVLQPQESQLKSYGSMEKLTTNTNPEISAASDSLSRRTDNTRVEFRNLDAHDPLSAPSTEENFQLMQEKTLSFISAATYTTNTTVETITTKESELSEPVIISGAVANLCSATLGAGVLSLPYALSQAGIVIGSILLVASACATVCSIDLIVAACHIYDIYTYEALTEAALGAKMKFWLELSILLFSGGVAVAYIIAVGDILEKSHLLIQDSRPLTITLVWCIAMVPLSMLRKMQSLQFASAFGIASIGTLIFAAAVHLFQDQKGVASRDIASLENSNNMPAVFLSCLWPSDGVLSVLTACPIILFAFSCQCNVAAIFEELPEKITKANDPDAPMSGNNREVASKRTMDSRINRDQGRLSPTSTISDRTIETSNAHPMLNGVTDSNNSRINIDSAERSGTIITKDEIMHRVTVCSVTICAMLYGLVSLIALSDFGKNMTPNMLSSYRPVGVMQVAMSAMAAAVVMAFPLNIFPARVTITGWMLGTTFDNDYFVVTRDDDDNANLKKSQTNHSLLDEPLALLGNRDVEDGVGESIDIAEHSLSTALLGSHREMLPPTTTITDSSKLATDEDEITFSWKRHLFLTSLLTIMSLAFALVLPNISTVFGLLGGTAASFLGFVVPGFIGLRLSEDLFGSTNSNGDGSSRRLLHRANSCVNSTTIDICSSKLKLQFISWALLIGGICVGLLTTTVTLYSIIVPI